MTFDSSSKKVIFYVAAVLIVFICVSVLIWRDFKSHMEMPSISKADNISPGQKTTSQNSGFAIERQGPNSQAEVLKNEVLKRKIVISIAMPDDTKAKAIDEIKNLSAQLDNNSGYMQGWLQLGILRKFIGDYEGAVMAWQYAAIMWPNNYIAFNNLGDLYRFNLKDYPKAEKNMHEAIDLKPDFTEGYRNLADFYIYAYKEKSDLAVPTLLEGLKKNPTAVDLLTYLASYYEDQGDKANAKKYYEMALAQNPPNSEAIKEELSAISK